MSKILIVDDSRTSRKILRTLLEEAGHEIVAEAENGQDGVEKYKEFKPEVTTLDITMPVMDGLEALPKIKEAHPEITVVMVSAAGQKNKVMEALKNGASDFLQKPFEPEDVISVLKKFV